MTKHHNVLSVIILGIVWLTRGAVAQVPAELIEYPELILHNGTVLTVDDNDTVAQAVALRDGEFLAVGSDAELLELAGPETRRIDLEGKTVIPGIINTHTHPNRRLGTYFDELPGEVQEILTASGGIRNPRDKADALAQVRRIAVVESGPWVKISAQRTDLMNH